MKIIFLFLNIKQYPWGIQTYDNNNKNDYNSRQSLSLRQRNLQRDQIHEMNDKNENSKPRGIRTVVNGNRWVSN